MDLDGFARLHPTYDPDLGLLTLDLHHGKANEMGRAELDAFETLCSEVENDDRVRCLVTTSRRRSAKGRPIFIAGANVTERSGWSDDEVRAHVARQRNLMVRLRRLPVFHVAVPAGATLGWGLEYLLTADYVVAAEDAFFALPETGLGIVPGARGTADLALRVGVPQALRLGCVGERIHVDEALRIGLVQEQVATVDEGLHRARAMAAELARRSPLAVAAYKQAVLDALGRPEAERLAAEAAAYDRCVTSGEAAVGRRYFAQVLSGEIPPWGPRTGR